MGRVDSRAQPDAQGVCAENPDHRRGADHGLLRGPCLGKAGGRGYLRHLWASEDLPMIVKPALLAVLIATASTGLVLPARADTATVPAAGIDAATLGKVMRLDALFAVLRDEGLQRGREMADGMFDGDGGAGWDAALMRIYDADALRTRFEAVLQRELAADPAAAKGVVDFYGSDLGQRILGLEVEARRAFLDKAAEEAAEVAADDAAVAKDPKVALIKRMIEACDLLEMNVAGSLTSNLAFAQGMVESGGYGTPVPLDQLSSDAWSQEDQTRSDLSTWLYSYLGLAYSSLTEAEMTRYVAFWESPAGQRLNRALFLAFDEVFRPVSEDLGRAAGTAMQGRDI
jgi:Uncharacterized protein conserved in bacteria (DUF2059)